MERKILIRDPLASGTIGRWGFDIERGLRQTHDTAAGSNGCGGSRPNHPHRARSERVADQDLSFPSRIEQVVPVPGGLVGFTACSAYTITAGVS